VVDIAIEVVCMRLLVVVVLLALAAMDILVTGVRGAEELVLWVWLTYKRRMRVTKVMRTIGNDMVMLKRVKCRDNHFRLPTTSTTPSISRNININPGQTIQLHTTTRIGR